MKTSNPRHLKILTFVGLLCMIIPLFIFGLWIHSFGLGTTQAERVDIFHSFLPDFLHGRYNATYLMIAFSISAIFISSFCLKISGKLWKALNTIILIISILLLALLLFSLM